MTLDRQPMYIQAVTRLEWLNRIKVLDADLSKEMTSLVTPKAEISGIDTLEIALDWLVHVGGPIREGIEASVRQRLQTASELVLSLAMRADPVAVFEIESWIGKTLIPAMRDRENLPPLRLSVRTSRELRREWSEAVGFFSSLPWNAETETDELSFAARGLGVFSVLERHRYDEFLNSMREAEVDLGEPPWIFWSRLPGWSAHRKSEPNNAEALFEFAARLTFLRCALSPQDEVSEASSLSAGGLMMNPTFETLLRPESQDGARENPILAFCRRGEAVVHRTVSALEAMALDHVREAFRSDRGQVASELSRESGVRKEFILSTVTVLVADGFLLAPSDGAAPTH